MENQVQHSFHIDATTLQTQAVGLAEKSLAYGMTLLSAIVILVCGYILSRWAGRFVRQRLEQVDNFDSTLIPFIAQIARYIVLLFTFILVLAEFGIQTTSIIAILGAAGLAIGLALQGTLQNVAAGIMLLIIRPFRVGDYVQAGDAEGTVDEIGLFMTRMHTAQNIFVAVPNSKIWSSTITNYSKRPRRRIDLLVGISYDDNIDEAIGVLMHTLGEHDLILNKPEPEVLVKNLGESSVDLELRAWTKRRDYLTARSDLIRQTKYALDNAKISIPYPHREIILQGSGQQDAGQTAT